MSHRRPDPPRAGPPARPHGAAAPAPAAAGRVASALPRSTGRGLLRTVAAGDAPALQAYRGLPEVTRFLGHPPLDLDGTEQLLARWLADDSGVTVVAEVAGRVVGDVRVGVVPCHALTPTSTAEVEARIGYAFHPEVWGRGLATASVRQVVDLALDQGGVRRVTARVFAPARSSSRLLLRMRFHLDGVDRAAALAPDGSGWWDDECWSLLREDRAAGPPLTRGGGAPHPKG